MISACILAKNEEKNITDCILSVIDVVDEVIVVDNDSTDKTKSICEDLNCRVITIKGKNESELRNEYIKIAKNPWILVLDADERADEKLGEHINKYFENIDEEIDIIRFPINNYYGNGKWATFIAARLFKKSLNIKYEGNTHCTISYSNVRKYGLMESPIHHLDALIKNRTSNKRDGYMINMINQINDMKEEKQKWRITNYLGVEYLAKDDYEKAEECFKLAQKNDSFYKPLATVYLSQCYLKQNRLEDSINALAEVIHLKFKKDIDLENFNYMKFVDDTVTEDILQRACIIYADIACKQNQFNEAIFWTKLAIRIWPFASQHYLNMASILYHNEDILYTDYLIQAISLNKYILDSIIYSEEERPNIYSQQTSIIDLSDKLLMKLYVNMGFIK